MKKIVLPAVCMAVVFGLGYLLKLAFALPTTTLATALAADAGAGTRFELADGASFTGRGKIDVGGEIIVIERIKEDGIRVTKGSELAARANFFKVMERAANGTTAKAHAAGTSVKATGTLFFPENNATYGDAVDRLFYIILWITGIAFVLTEGFFLYILIAFWAKPGQRAQYSHGNHKLELIWTAVPALILVALAIIQSGMWTEMKMNQPDPKAPGVVQVQVAAMQYNWFFRYAGNDNQFGTADDVATMTMRVPVGRKIALTIRSRDTLHSFFLPNYRLKQDAVPGLAVPAWFEAIRTGTYQIMCAELCGLGHTGMGADLVVLPSADFDEWVKTASEESAGANDGVDRPDWYGQNMWWWWDSVPTQSGFVGIHQPR